MAELIKSEFGLPVLKLTLGRGRRSSSRGDESIVFDVQRGEEQFSTKTFVPMEFGLAPDLDWTRKRYSDPPFELPYHFDSWLQQSLADVLQPPEPLWLQLGPPTGYLALFPWERLLHDIVPSPILRLPHYALFPTLAVDSLDVVLCSSAPEAKLAFDGVDLIIRAGRRLMESLPAPVNLHVFVDSSLYQVLRGRVGHLEQSGGRVHLYDPSQASTEPELRGQSLSDPVRPISSPWLQWIVEAMAGLTAEVVHFITHAYLSRDQAALAVAEMPSRNRDRSWARFIGPNQIAACVNQLGGWVVGFSSPPGNFSPPGFRLLGDDLAQLRPGPIILHDFRDDPDASQLGQAYAALLAHATPRRLRGVAMYSHPQLTRDTVPETSVPRSAAQVAVEETLGSASAAPSAPAWVQSTRRILEQSTAQHYPEEQRSPEEDALAEGVKRALAFLGEVIAEASGPLSEPDDSGEER
jgi:hypothetical protein